MTISLKDLLGWGAVVLLILTLLFWPLAHDFVQQVRSNTDRINALMESQRPLVVNHYNRGSYPQQVVTNDELIMEVEK